MVTKTTLCKLFLMQTNTECRSIIRPQHNGYPEQLHRMLVWENPCEFQCGCFSKITTATCAPEPFRAKHQNWMCKIRKTKRLLLPFLPELLLTAGEKNMTTESAQQLMSRLALFRPGLHTDRGCSHREQRSPGTMTGNTLVGPTLFRPDLFMILR